MNTTNMYLDAFKSLPYLIEKIGDVDFYKQVIDSVTYFEKIKSCKVISYPYKSNPKSIAFDNTVKVELLNEYCQSAYLLDPFYHIIRHKKHSDFISLNDIKRKDFKKSNYYEKFYFKVDEPNEINYIISCKNDNSIALSFHIDDSIFYNINNKIQPFFESIKAAIQTHESLQRAVTAPLMELSAQAKNSQLNTKLSRYLLTTREQEITQLILEGHSSKSISSLCFISEGTVKNHRKNIYRKMGIKSQRDLFKRFIF